MHCTESRIRVRYAETDQMGVVYYANYLVWMEVARVEYCRQIGFEYRDMEADGAVLAVTEVKCQYRAPARFDDEVRILTHVTGARSRTIRFAYEMRRAGDEQLLAQGETVHTVCDRAGKMIRLPEKYRAYFPASTGPSLPEPWA
jgi:acyl-CoA thioester hydrolase